MFIFFTETTLSFRMHILVCVCVHHDLTWIIPYIKMQLSKFYPLHNDPSHSHPQKSRSTGLWILVRTFSQLNEVNFNIFSVLQQDLP